MLWKNACCLARDLSCSRRWQPETNSETTSSGGSNPQHQWAGGWPRQQDLSHSSWKQDCHERTHGNGHQASRWARHSLNVKLRGSHTVNIPIGHIRKTGAEWLRQQTILGHRSRGRAQSHKLQKEGPTSNLGSLRLCSSHDTSSPRVMHVWGCVSVSPTSVQAVKEGSWLGRSPKPLSA